MRHTIDDKHVAMIAAILYQHPNLRDEKFAVEIAVKLCQEAQSACEKFNGEVCSA